MACPETRRLLSGTRRAIPGPDVLHPAPASSNVPQVHPRLTMRPLVLPDSCHLLAATRVARQSHARSVAYTRLSLLVSTHSVSSLLGSVFRWDQRLRPNGSLWSCPELWLTSRCSANLWRKLTNVIADVIGDSSLISPYFCVYFWVSEKVEWFSLIKTK